MIPHTRLVYVYSQREYREAVKASRDTGIALTIENGPGTCRYNGFLYIKAMISALQSFAVNDNIQAVFNADNDTPAAIEALKAGFRTIRFRGNQAVREKLNDIAGQYNSTVLEPASGTQHIDLYGKKNPYQEIINWLER